MDIRCEKCIKQASHLLCEEHSKGLDRCHHNIPTVFQKGDTYFVFCTNCKKMLLSFSAEPNHYKLGTFGNSEGEEYFNANNIPLEKNIHG